MKNTKPASGTRDFLPSEVRKREYVIGIIKEVYEKYGFEPLETPSYENLETLTGKYGEEGNQLMFRILKRGEKLTREIEAGNISENDLADSALRYDLTVPLARVVANYKNELPKFFKRYQIQPVWRADRPARGRYREFYQCDVDAIGSSSMIVEAELISAVCEILQKLGFKDFEFRVNHRKLLSAVLSMRILQDKHLDTLVALDKLDKIGTEGVFKELVERGIDEEVAEDTIELFSNLEKIASKNEDNRLNNMQVLRSLKEEISQSDEKNISIQSLEKIIKYSESNSLKIFPSLARGLSYYTGAIFEVILTNGDFAGSIAGGGRYDSLIGMFGKEQIPAVGFSLGLERILLIMEERGMFPDDLTINSADVMVTLWNEETASESLKLAGELRATGLRVLVYPEADKLGKQFKYADSLEIPYVCILGENELAAGEVAVKNMKTGEQESVERENVAGKIRI